MKSMIAQGVREVSRERIFFIPQLLKVAKKGEIKESSLKP